jgi:hypothetical protein
MPGDKHSSQNGTRAQTLLYGGFRGLNLALPSEQIDRSELTEAVNVEYDVRTNGLKMRGGMVPMSEFPADIADMIHIPGMGFLIRLNDRRMYLMKAYIQYELGQSSGDGPLSAVLWEDAKQALVASGGKLQKINSFGITTFNESPEHCHAVFVRSGRACVVGDDDMLYFSWVGDPEKWDNDPNDAQSGQFLEVGYKDGMDIRAVGNLSRDIIVFKSSPLDTNSAGIVYRVVGDFPDIEVVEAARDTGTFGQNTIKMVGNDLLYLTRVGIASLGTVSAYGEVRMNWPDTKIQALLADEMLLGEVRMYEDEDKQQLWIHTSKRIWVMHYGHGGDWTTVELPVNVTAMANGLVAYKRWVYRLHRWAAVDEVRDEGIFPLRAVVGFKSEFTRLQTLLKSVMVSYNMEAAVEVDWIANDRMRVPLVRRNDEGRHIAATDSVKAFLDDEPLVPAGLDNQTARRRCLFRGWKLNNKLEIRGSRFTLTGAAIQMVEV